MGFRLSSTTYRKDRTVFTQNALESPLLSQPQHGLVLQGNKDIATKLRIDDRVDTTAENPPPIEELRDFEDDMLKVIQSVKFKQFKQVNNPPFSKNTSTNIGNKFLALVDEHFPKDHKLRKIFNRNTIKISYSCMNDTKQIIDNHNKRILTASIQTDDTAAAAIINKELKKARF